jgi:LPXTG-motif cell wall-anchored protein
VLGAIAVRVATQAVDCCPSTGGTPVVAPAGGVRTATTPGVVPTGSLPLTGAQISTILVVCALLLLFGALLLVAGRRRKPVLIPKPGVLTLGAWLLVAGSLIGGGRAAADTTPTCCPPGSTTTVPATGSQGTGSTPTTTGPTTASTVPPVFVPGGGQVPVLPESPLPVALPVLGTGTAAIVLLDRRRRAGSRTGPAPSPLHPRRGAHRRDRHRALA